jgi:sec-independent protein translocase protein TatA
MGIESPLHLLFILAVALVVLGPKRLPELARAIGKGVREFRGAMEAAQTEPSRSDNLAQTSPSDHLAGGEPSPGDQLAQTSPSDHLGPGDLGGLGAPGEPAHAAPPAEGEAAGEEHAAG